MRKKEEIYSEEELMRIKARIKLKKVFGKYIEMKEILLDEVVDKMLTPNYDSTGSSGSGQPVDKLSTLSNQRLDAERFVKSIDTIMNELDDRSYQIIYLLYIDGEKSDREIYEYQLYVSKATYYRWRWKAEKKMYKKLIINNEKLC